MLKKVLIAAVMLGFASTSTFGSESAQPLKVGMSSWVGYGLLHLAQSKGFFEKNGTDVEIVTVQDKPSTAAAIATGRLDGWATTVDAFIFYNAQKIGAKQVLTVDFSRGGEGIIATSEIKSVKDLTGKTVGAEEGSSTYFFMLNVLADAGLRVQDLQFKNMRAGDAGAAFVAGRLDAAATYDPWLAEASKRAGHVLIDTKEKPGLIVDTVAFRTDVIEKRSADVKAFIKAYFEAYDYWKENPEESNKIMAKALEITEDDFQQALNGLEFVSREANLSYLGTPETKGRIDDVIRQGVASYKELGLLKEDVDPASITDPTPLNEVLKD